MRGLGVSFKLSRGRARNSDTFSPDDLHSRFRYAEQQAVSSIRSCFIQTFYLWQVYATGTLGRQESLGSPSHKLRARQMGLTPPDVEISTTVTTNLGKDSPTILRERGVEDGSNRTDFTDFDPSMNRTMRQEQRQNSFSCEQCSRNFGTLRGLKVHQGKTCKKKSRPCRSSDRKTRSQSSQDKHHSGLMVASVDSTSSQSQNEEDQQPQEESARRPKVLWPAANEKKKYQAFEDKVKQRFTEATEEIEEYKDYLAVFAELFMKWQ